MKCQFCGAEAGFLKRTCARCTHPSVESADIPSLQDLGIAISGSDYSSGSDSPGASDCGSSDPGGGSSCGGSSCGGGD